MDGLLAGIRERHSFVRSERSLSMSSGNFGSWPFAFGQGGNNQIIVVVNNMIVSLIMIMIIIIIIMIIIMI